MLYTAIMCRKSSVLSIMWINYTSGNSSKKHWICLLFSAAKLAETVNSNDEKIKMFMTNTDEMENKIRRPNFPDFY